MSRENRLIKSTLVLGLGNLLPKASLFITIPILTALLTKEEYGAFDLITILSSLLLPTASLQIQTAAFRFLIDARKNDSSITNIITNIFCFVVPQSLFVLLLAFFLMPGSLALRLSIVVYLYADMLLETGRQIARGLDKNVEYSVNSVLQSFLSLVLLIVFVWVFRLGLLGAVLSLAFSSLCSLSDICIRIGIRRYIRFNAFSFDSVKRLISYSWPMVPNCLSMWIMTVSDRFVVTIFMGVAANAVYSVANKIPSILTLFQTTFTMAWQENASVASSDADADDYYSTMYRVVLDLMAGVLGLLICATPLLFMILIRGDYAEAYRQIPILYLAMFFYSMCAFLGGIYVAHKDTRSVGITTTAAAVCNLALDLAAIRTFGLYAASLSTLMSYVFLFCFRIINVQKLVKLRIDIGHMLIVVGLLLIELLLCFFQRPVLNLMCIPLALTVFYALNRRVLLNAYHRVRSWL